MGGADNVVAENAPKRLNPFDPHWQPTKEDIAYNHVESFNLFLTHMLEEMPKNMRPCFIQNPKVAEQVAEVTVSNLHIAKPKKNKETSDKAMPLQTDILPHEIREAKYTYCGKMTGTITVKHSLGTVVKNNFPLGEMPIMVKSKGCHLHGLGPKELVAVQEEEDEFGGFFLISGNERIMRLLNMQRANHIFALDRPSFVNRGPLYTTKATTMRCMRPDMTTATVTMHYKRDGSCTLRVIYYRSEYMFPLVLIAKALSEYSASDQTIFERFMDGVTANSGFVGDRVKTMLEQHKEDKAGFMKTQRHALAHLGESLRPVMQCPTNMPAEEVGRAFIDEMLFVHTKDYEHKFNCMVMMFQKLMGFVKGDVRCDNADAFSSHEILLPGQLYGMVVKEAIENRLNDLRTSAIIGVRRRDATLEEVLSGPSLDRELRALDVSKDVRYFMSTGNVRTRTGMDLSQTTGFTIMADKLNAFRYMSHFRSIHRGQFFTTMKTTAVRKLLPETWGFLCPVHTPDGTPCGLLNHLSAQCVSVIRPPDQDVYKNTVEALQDLDVDTVLGRPYDAALFPADCYAPITVDGILVGKVRKSRLQEIANKLRYKKVKGMHNFPIDMEIAYVMEEFNLWGGIFIYSGPCRAVRPVSNLNMRKREWIGPIEQMFLNIAVSDVELKENYKHLAHNNQLAELGDREVLPVDYTHLELSPLAALSYLASLTPFSNHNQSPRNMYQCQMLKQTMGTPYLNNPSRTDNKSYKIYTPQRPMVRTKSYHDTNFNTHPAGTNAVVAVICRTGYDMEDAMVLNKASVERGLKHGVVYKTKVVDAFTSNYGAREWRFCRKGLEHGEHPHIGEDGLPKIGTKLVAGMLYYNVAKTGLSGENRLEKYKDEEDAYVEQVTLVEGGNYGNQKVPVGAQRALIHLRIPRNPNIGDKFASRHGQKGVLSIRWPQENMPFSARGVVPDICFNPHGFPSRMTIGMLIESIAGKAAALHGIPNVDATTFRKYNGTFTGDVNNEDDPFLADQKKAKLYRKTDTPSNPAEYFGDALKEKGFEYMGTDELYCGMFGEPIKVKIFMGVIYYQRLRHMVNDKAQVRGTGACDPMTRQPVKGRKRGGGVRFGEMERDSLIAHGASWVCKDRLLRSSDMSFAPICTSCGRISSAIRQSSLDPRADINTKRTHLKDPADDEVQDVCRVCNEVCKLAVLPFVWRTCVFELLAMNMDVRCKTTDLDDVKFGDSHFPEIIGIEPCGAIDDN